MLRMQRSFEFSAAETLGIPARAFPISHLVSLKWIYLVLNIDMSSI